MNLSDIIKTAEALKHSHEVLTALLDNENNRYVLSDNYIKGLSDAKDFIEGILEEWGMLK